MQDLGGERKHATTEQEHGMGNHGAESGHASQASRDQDKAWSASDQSDRLKRIEAATKRENSAASSRNARRGI